jgi:hypothetical protein
MAEPARKWMVRDAHLHSRRIALRERVERFRALLRPELRTRIGIVSYERIADVLSASGEAELGKWVRQRITDVAASRRW